MWDRYNRIPVFADVKSSCIAPLLKDVDMNRTDVIELRIEGYWTEINKVTKEKTEEQTTTGMSSNSSDLELKVAVVDT